MGIYDQVLSEIRQFLPLNENVERFLERQCRSHINVEPTLINTTHLPELARWIGISAGLLIPKERAFLLRRNIERLH